VAVLNRVHLFTFELSFAAVEPELLTTMFFPFPFQVHICMTKGDSFPSIHGQLDVKGLAFQILDAASSFSVCLHFTLVIHFPKSIFKIGYFAVIVIFLVILKS
jgi:hypothetical protein